MFENPNQEKRKEGYTKASCPNCERLDIYTIKQGSLGVCRKCGFRGSPKKFVWIRTKASEAKISDLPAWWFKLPENKKLVYEQMAHQAGFKNYAEWDRDLRKKEAEAQEAREKQEREKEIELEKRQKFIAELKKNPKEYKKFLRKQREAQKTPLDKAKCPYCNSTRKKLVFEGAFKNRFEGRVECVRCRRIYNFK